MARAIKVRYGLLNSQGVAECGDVMEIDEAEFDRSVEKRKREAADAILARTVLLHGDVVEVETNGSAIEITQVIKHIPEEVATQIEREEEECGERGIRFVYRHGGKQIPYLCWTHWYEKEES